MQIWRNDRSCGDTGGGIDFRGDCFNSVEKLEEIFLYCYEQPDVMPQPARSKQARKWHDLLELLND